MDLWICGWISKLKEGQHLMEDANTCQRLWGLFFLRSSQSETKDDTSALLGPSSSGKTTLLALEGTLKLDERKEICLQLICLEENVYMCKLAEQAEQYKEMVESMEKVAKTVDVEELTVEECNLLSVAWKNVIGARRVSGGVQDCS